MFFCLHGANNNTGQILTALIFFLFYRPTLTQCGSKCMNNYLLLQQNLISLTKTCLRKWSIQCRLQLTVMQLNLLQVSLFMNWYTFRIWRATGDQVLLITGKWSWRTLTFLPIYNSIASLYSPWTKIGLPLVLLKEKSEFLIVKLWKEKRFIICPAAKLQNMKHSHF